MDMSREDICRLALAAVDPVTLGRKIWLKPGVNKLDGKFLGLSDPALTNVQAWVIHSANKGFFGTNLAVVGAAPSQVLQFDTGKMISVSKGQKIQLRTGDIIYLVEERHPFMVLHLSVNETGPATGAQSTSNESILDESKVVLQHPSSTSNTIVPQEVSSAVDRSTMQIDDSMVAEPDLSAATVNDNTVNNSSVSSVKEHAPSSEEANNTIVPMIEENNAVQLINEVTQKESTTSNVIASPIYKVVNALDLEDFVSKYGEPLTSRKCKIHEISFEHSKLILLQRRQVNYWTRWKSLITDRCVIGWKQPFQLLSMKVKIQPCVRCGLTTITKSNLIAKSAPEEGKKEFVLT